MGSGDSRLCQLPAGDVQWRGDIFIQPPASGLRGRFGCGRVRNYLQQRADRGVHQQRHLPGRTADTRHQLRCGQKVQTKRDAPYGRDGGDHIGHSVYGNRPSSASPGDRGLREADGGDPGHVGPGRADLFPVILRHGL